MNLTLLIQGGDFWVRFLLTLIFVSLLTALANSKKVSSSQNTYTYFVISIVVFFLCFTLNTLDLNLGMALGLFAIFGIIRYRTETIKTEDMTYLFAFIGLSVINALTPFDKLIELILINFIIISCIAIAQRLLLVKEKETPSEIEIRKTQLVVDIEEDLTALENRLKSEFEVRYQKTIQRVELKCIDHQSQKITFILFY